MRRPARADRLLYPLWSTIPDDQVDRFGAFFFSKYRIERTLRYRYPDRAAWVDSRVPTSRGLIRPRPTPRKRDGGRTASGGATATPSRLFGGKALPIFERLL